MSHDPKIDPQHVAMLRRNREYRRILIVFPDTDQIVFGTFFQPYTYVKLKSWKAWAKTAEVLEVS